ncbi:MAG TPA: hypothetical protein VMY99_04765 [Nevskiaceae bacterium]|nr:hypothetical protein [Nevskiaceae bacterium]
MNTPTTNPETAGSPEVWESLFPFDVPDLANIQQRLLRVTTEDLGSFVEVRKHGSPQNILTALYGAQLADWRVKRGDFTSTQARLFFKVGELYGTQMAGDQYYEYTGETLSADDPDAYDVAVATVKSSYDELELSDDLPQWLIEKYREMVHTGSDKLSVLNAVLHDRIQNQFRELYGDIDIPTAEALESFYMGLIDSVLFYNTYARFRKGLHPQQFEVAVAHTPIFDPDVHRLVTQSLNDADPTTIGALELEPTDNIAVLIQNMVPTDEAAQWFAVTANNCRYRIRAAKVVTQVGANEFRHAYNIMEIHFVEEEPKGRGLVDKVRRYIGIPALVGAVSMNAYDVAVGHLTDERIGVLQSTSGGMCMGTLMGTFLSLGVARRRAKEAEAAFLASPPQNSQE